MREIVLASASPRRSELLKQVGVEFKVLPSNIEENIDLRLSPEEYAQSLSYEKAFNIAEKLRSSLQLDGPLPMEGNLPVEGTLAMNEAPLVIGADTIVVKDGILGKPEDDGQAYLMLKSLQGGWHDVITGVTVIDTLSLKASKCSETTHVKMRELSDEFIYSYIRTGEHKDKAGAYGIQGIGAVLVERIEGCYFNVVGLPLTRLSIIFEEFGVRLL